MCIYNFFANLGAGWVNGATVVSAVFGILFSIFAFFFSIWFSRKLSNSTDSLLQEANQVTKAVRQNTEATQVLSAATHKHTKVLRIDNLRNLYELSKGQSQHGYWTFRWRFETYDCLTLQLQQKNGNDITVLGHCKADIQGFSNAADHLGFEHRESEFYVVKIRNAQASEGQEFPFQDGDTLACFDNNGQTMISKGTDPWTMSPKYAFSITGLGHQQIGHGEVMADTAQIFPRIKDS